MDNLFKPVQVNDMMQDQRDVEQSAVEQIKGICDRPITSGRKVELIKRVMAWVDGPRPQ